MINRFARDWKEILCFDGFFSLFFIYTSIFFVFFVILKLVGMEGFLFGAGAGVGIDLVSFSASVARPALYPLFFEIMNHYGLNLIYIVQVLLLIAAISLLVFALKSYFPISAGRFLFVLAGLASLLNPRVLEYALTVSHEGLFIPFILFSLAFCLISLRNQSPVSLFFAAFFVACAIGVRGAGQFLVPVLFFTLLSLLFFIPKNTGKGRCIKRTILVFSVFFGLSLPTMLEARVFHSYFPGQDRQSVLGVNLIAKAGLLVADHGLTLPLPGEASAAEADLRTEIRGILIDHRELASKADAALSTFSGKQFVTNYMEFEFQLRGVSPRLTDTVRALADLRNESVDSVSTMISVEVFKDVPLAFVERVFGNLFRFLWMAEFPTRGGYEEAIQLRDLIGPDEFDSIVSDGYGAVLPLAERYRLIAWPFRIAHLLFVLGLFYSLLVLVTTRDRLRWSQALAVATIGVSVLGYLLLCAIVINVQVRYIMTIWPLTVMAVAGAFTLLLARHRLGEGMR